MATAFPGTKPFPTQASQAAAPIGHNKPPLEEVIVAEFEEGLRSVDGLMRRIDQLVERGNAAGPCETEEMAGRYGDYLKMVRAIAGTGGTIEAEREKHNRPLLTAQRALKGRSDALIAQLNGAAAKVRTHLDKYVNDQRKLNYARSVIQHIRNCGNGFIEDKPYPLPILIRELEEKVEIDSSFGELESEARSALEESLTKLKAAYDKFIQKCNAADEEPDTASSSVEPVVSIPTPKVEEPVVRGDYGARVGSTTVWRHEIESVRKLPDSILKHEKVVETLNKVIAAQVRGGTREIKGVRIWSEQATTVR